MNEIKFGSIVPQFQPAPENVKITHRVAADFRRSINGTLVTVGDKKIYRQWRVILPCGDDFTQILALAGEPFSFTDLDGDTAEVEIIGLGEMSEPIRGMGECEILMEETTPWDSGGIPPDGGEPPS